MKKKITVFAPATIANFGPGFDVFGAALGSLGDFVIAEALEDEKGDVKIKYVEGDVPKEPEKNTAGISAAAAIKILKEKYKIKTNSVMLSIIKNIPQGGLGGSAASAVAGAVAVNELFDKKLSINEIISASLEAENAVSGYHLDNILPSLVGGFVLLKNYEPLKYVKFNPPKNLYCIVANPMIMSYLTKDARKNLPKKEDVLKINKKYLFGLLKGIKINDIKKIGENIRDDVVEPLRAKLIPGFEDVKNSALRAGAFGASISGSGPSVFAVCDDISKARKIGGAMEGAFKRNGMKIVFVIVSRASKKGARAIESPY